MRRKNTYIHTMRHLNTYIHTYIHTYDMIYTIENAQGMGALFYSPVDFTDASDLNTLMQV